MAIATPPEAQPRRRGRPAAPRPPADPFRYGWRFVPGDGEGGFVQVPLSRQDLLHPQEGDFIVESDARQRRCRYLADALETLLPPKDGYTVLMDMRVDWGVEGLRPHGPDIVVVRGVQERQDWTTFEVQAEQASVVFVLEVVSKNSAENDRRIKLDHYRRAMIPYYLLVDAIGRRRQGVPEVLGYRLVAGKYEPVPAREDGRVPLADTGLSLGVVNAEIVIYDSDGRQRGTYDAVQAHADAESARADELAARAAAEATARAEAEARAAAEAAARADVERRLQELEAELRRRGGGAR